MANTLPNLVACLIAPYFMQTIPYSVRIAAVGRVLLKAGPRPTARHGPATRRSEGPAARGPRPAMARRPGGPEAPTVLLSSGKSMRMHRFASGLGAQMKDGEFEFVYHFNNHFNPFPSFLSLHVAK